MLSMTNSKSRYSPYAKHDRTFEQLFDTYTMVYFKGLNKFDVNSKAKVLAVAQRMEKANEFRLLDVADHLEPVLKECMQSFNPAKGLKFEKLFERDLRRKLWRELSRLRARWRRQQQPRPTDQNADHIEVSYKRWSLCLVNVVLPGLDGRTDVHTSSRA